MSGELPDYSFPPRIEPDPWQAEKLNPRQAAAYLRVSVGTLKNWRCRDYGPAYFKVGNAVWYPLPDLKRFIRECRIDPSHYG